MEGDRHHHEEAPGLSCYFPASCSSVACPNTCPVPYLRGIFHPVVLATRMYCMLSTSYLLRAREANEVTHKPTLLSRTLFTDANVSTVCFLFSLSCSTQDMTDVRRRALRSRSAATHRVVSSMLGDSGSRFTPSALFAPSSGGHDRMLRALVSSVLHVSARSLMLSGRACCVEYTTSCDANTWTTFD